MGQEGSTNCPRSYDDGHTEPCSGKHSENVHHILTKGLVKYKPRLVPKEHYESGLVNGYFLCVHIPFIPSNLCRYS